MASSMPRTPFGKENLHVGRVVLFKNFQQVVQPFITCQPPSLSRLTDATSSHHFSSGISIRTSTSPAPASTAQKLGRDSDHRTSGVVPDLFRCCSEAGQSFALDFLGPRCSACSTASSATTCDYRWSLTALHTLISDSASCFPCHN